MGGNQTSTLYLCKGGNYMEFEYVKETTIKVNANSIEEAEEKLKSDDFEIVDEVRRLYNVYDDGVKMHSTMNADYDTVYYKTSCPLGYDGCICDDARKKAENCHCTVLTEETPKCTYNDGCDYCDWYDDECK